MSYCRVSVSDPLTAIVQLNAAYVPLIWAPFTMAVTLKGHAVGTKGVTEGVAVSVTALPCTSPSTLPALLFLGSANVGPCTSSVRVNIRGLPGDHYKDKKA